MNAAVLPQAATIIIPAHNEETIIADLLKGLPLIIKQGAVHVIVACNGCTDRTADIARECGATVVEVSHASKISALNAGDQVATTFPRIYVDADVTLTRKAIEDVVGVLSGQEVHCAAPLLHVEVTGRPWLVRAYFKVWTHVVGRQAGYVGSGVYALSQKGRARFTRFPEVIADDLYVRCLFTNHERLAVVTTPFIIKAPWTLRSLFRRRVRIELGNLELLHSEIGATLPGRAAMDYSRITALIGSARQIPAALVYTAVNLTARLVARRKHRSRAPVEWARDDTIRS